MSAAYAGAAALTLMLVATAATTASAQPAVQSAGAAPHVLNIVHVKVKPQSAGAYATLEAQIARAYERAKMKLYWICLQSPKDAKDVLYLNLFDAADGPERATALYQSSVKQHPELVQLSDRLRDLTASSASTLTTRRDDVDRLPRDVDFATMRTLRITTVQVKPGHEGDFLKAVRTTAQKEGTWLVYEANDSSTYALMSLKRGPFNRRDGAPLPRALRRFRGLRAKPETKIYNVRPTMSHVSQAFIAANPQLWRPAPTATH